MYTGPKLTNNSLVFGADTGYGVANIGTPTVHFKGKPTTNLTTSTLTSVFSSWGGLVGTSTTYTDGYLGGSGVRVAITTGGGVNWWSSPSLTGLSGNTQYTVSATIKLSGRSFNGDDANMLYIREYNSGNNQLREAGYFNTGRMTDLGDGWYRIWGTVTTQATTNRILLHGYSYTTNTYIHIQDLQFELGETASPFAGYNGSRSTTAGLIDLKRTRSIDLSNASFDSTGQPIFDGTSDYISVANTAYSFSDGATVEQVIKFTAINRQQGFFTLNHIGGAPSGQNIYINFWMSTNNLMRWEVIGDSGVTYATINATTAVTVGKHYHFVGVFNGTTTTIYVNGVAETTQTMTNQPLAVTSQMEIGRYNSTYPSASQIPVTRFYNQPLTAGEIQSNYKAYKSRFNI